MPEKPTTTAAADETDGGEEAVVPERPRLPIVSLAITAVFLALGGLLLYFVRAEVAYFFSGKAPSVSFHPTRTQPVPPSAPSNVLAEVRVDYKALCDFWDTEKSPFPPEVSYAFTLQMGMGKRYFLTCVGDGDVRPRLWILRPESEEETKRIHVDAVSRRLGQSMLSAWTEDRVPEIHIPGGPGCVNDLCRGRLVELVDPVGKALGGKLEHRR